jgi:putative hydrolase of the HAD superfamily
MFDLIAFDADDTLWHNERLYRMGRERFHRLLAKYGLRDTLDEIDERVNQTELQNLRYYGYGVTSFVLSLIEASIELTGGRISAVDIRELLDLSKEMLSAPVDLFEGARETVARLSTTCPLMLITKGDLLHQQAKVDQSGLRDYFRYVEVVSDKSLETYAAILSRRAIQPSRFLMVGNSLRSDILPVIQLGGWAVYIPAELSWSHEHVDAVGALGDRCSELGHLGELPAFVDGLTRKHAD